jgi:hypothetical protein
MLFNNKKSARKFSFSAEKYVFMFADVFSPLKRERIKRFMFAENAFYLSRQRLRPPALQKQLKIE